MSATVKPESKQIYIYESYWNRLPFCSKVLFLVTVPLAIVGYFTDYFRPLLANHVHFTISAKQYSRLFTSFLVNERDLGVIFKLIFLSFSLPYVERSYSTPYTIVQFLLQTFLFNACFALVGIALASSLDILNFFGFLNYYTIASLGVTHLVFIFIWARVAINPDLVVKIFGLPLRVKVKYLPWCFLAIFSIFGPDLQALIGFMLGFLQFMVLKRSIFCFPKSIYKIIEFIFPKCIRPMISYVSIRSAQRYLTIIREDNLENEAVSLSDNVKNEAISQQQSQVESVQEEK